MDRYDHRQIEQKWQTKWAQQSAYAISGQPTKKYYCLDMFPYPSGAGLHVGHPRGYTATDVLCRMRRAQGFDVLHPMGWDAFGLPAENTAIKEGAHPSEITKRNIARFREQLQSLGLSYDWDREFSTTDPDYYRWTQWIFLQLYKRGLAYEAELPIWWCPKDKTGLANEEVVNGTCERCGTVVERKQLRQWVLKITEYANRLLEGLDELDWPESIKAMQRNWIGRKEGVVISHQVKDLNLTVESFSAYPAWLFADTFIVIAPEHPLVGQLANGTKYEQAVTDFVAESGAINQEERIQDRFEKKGQFTGRMAIDPFRGIELPIWVANFALMDFGTGVIRCSAHDPRDYEFATKYGISLNEVVARVEPSQPVNAHDNAGILKDSGIFTGYQITPALIEEMTGWITEQGFGRRETTYRLRDWLFSRQRYWGEPIPLIHCPTDGVVPLPEDQLPVLLPEIERYEPTGTGESPLAAFNDWVQTTCPTCGGPAKRETNTMPQWAGSCWYYLRFTDPKNQVYFASPEALKAWLAVDTYVGGAEHAVLHLLYARFWHKVLFDAGHIPTEVGDEPFRKLRNVGLILGENREKMSKSRGNVINPDDLIERFGADTLRAYEMFLGPFEDSMPWNTESLVGVRRWLDRVWRLAELVKDNGSDSEAARRAVEEAVGKVSADIEAFKFNTAVSCLMITSNTLGEEKVISRSLFHRYLQLLAPFAPHLAQELFIQTGGEDLIDRITWPEVNLDLTVQTVVALPVQVNGKVRGIIHAAPDETQEIVVSKALDEKQVQKYLNNSEPATIIYVPGKILNLVTRKD